MRNKIFLFVLIAACLLPSMVQADLTSHTEALLDTLILNLDTDADGAILDEGWYSSIDPLAAAPSAPVALQVYVADSEAAGWNPCANDDTTNYGVVYTGSAYLPIRKIDGTPVYMTAAPGTGAASTCAVATGYYYWADNSTWDPDTSVADEPTGANPYKVYRNTAGYVSVLQQNGTVLLSTLPMFTSTYIATSSVSASHLYGYAIDNYAQTADAIFTLAEPASGMNALALTVDTSNARTFRPYTGGQITFVDSTGAISQLAVNEGVTCSAANAVIGEELRITTYQTGASTWAYMIVQTIGDGFAEETP